MINPPERVDIARHFPLPEYSNLLEILLKHSVSGSPVPIVVPVCPDYPETGYQLGGGAGLTARRLAMPAAGFFQMTNSTVEEIRKEILLYGFGDSIGVGSMLDYFVSDGVDYASRQEELARQILDHSGRKVKQVIAGLIKERIANEDYQDLQLGTETEFSQAAAYELAGYAAYGELVGSVALICSPDAQSAVPGYNFLKKNNSDISPTALIKPPKREHGSLFIN